jgi:glycerophosphoryl diester phosphodiesterase
MNQPFDRYFKLKLPKLIAHRGASGYAPENTLAAIAQAHKLGAEWIEFDVMLTGCGEPIIIHDFTLKRTTNGKGRVRQKSYAEIAKLDAGSWFAPQFANEKIPTLAEMLKCAASYNLGINLELKPAAGKEQETTIKTLNLLKQHWPENLPLLISSSSVLTLEMVRKLDKKVLLGFIAHRWGRAWKKILMKYQCVSFHVNHEVLTPERIAQIKTIVPHVLAYTINDAQRMQELWKWGVDAGFTDYPDL